MGSELLDNVFQLKTTLEEKQDRTSNDVWLCGTAT